MSPDAPIIVGGIFIPTRNAMFLAVLAVHVGAGLLAVVAGAVAAIVRKGSRRHIRAGTTYYRSLIVVCATMTVLALIRWPHDIHLLILGGLSIGAGAIARGAVATNGQWRIHMHLLGMATSYTLLVVAFYVDNGKSLPLWKNIPPVAYWLIPVLFAMPFTIRALRHPLASTERRRPKRGMGA